MRRKARALMSRRKHCRKMVVYPPIEAPQTTLNSILERYSEITRISACLHIARNLSKSLRTRVHPFDSIQIQPCG